MRTKLLQVLLILAFLLPLCVFGAEPKISARIEPDTVMVGDQPILTIEVDKDIVQVVDFPQFENNKIGGVIEILAEFPFDTLETDGRNQKLAKRYLLTCFDEGRYNIDHFPVLYLDKNIVDTIYAPEQLSLFVKTIENIDTVNMTVYDIKAPLNTPFLASEVSGYATIGLIGLAVLVSIIYFIASRYRKREKVEENQRVKEPPHVIAIRELEHLNNQKIWQNNKHKLYYTRLTDILREYLEGRYGVHAMEMTSDEIVDAVVGVNLPPKNFDELKTILKSADLVKFAKHIPSPDENESSYYKAYYFVEETKEVMEDKAVEPEKMVEIS